jgi:hypothetical protein
MDGDLVAAAPITLVAHAAPADLSSTETNTILSITARHHRAQSIAPTLSVN